MYPDRDTLSNVPSSGYIIANDQSMVENGVTGDVNEHNNTITKPQTKKQRFLKLS